MTMNMAEVVAKNTSKDDEETEEERLVGKASTAAKELALNLKKRAEAAVHQQHQRRGAFWISAEEEKEIVLEKHTANSWQYRAVDIIQSHKVQVALVVLLVLDVLIVMTEVFLDAEYPPCSKVERDAISCMNASYAADATDASHHRRLGGGGGHALCPEGSVESGFAPACDSHKWATVHEAHTALLWLSVAVLGIFFVELSILVVALGAAFIRNRLYMLDFFVVTLSLVLEITISQMGEDALAALVGLIIFARMWRFVRIAHGLATTTHELGGGHGEHDVDIADELAETVDTLQVLLTSARARGAWNVATRKASKLVAEESSQRKIAEESIKKEPTQVPQLAPVMSGTVIGEEKV